MQIKASRTLLAIRCIQGALGTCRTTVGACIGYGLTDKLHSTTTQPTSIQYRILVIDSGSTISSNIVASKTISWRVTATQTLHST